MDVVASVNLTPFVEGDTWRGISSISIRVNGEPPENSLSSAKIVFRRRLGTQAHGATLSSVSGEITITDAANWELTVPQQTLNLPADSWSWSLETVDSSGVKKTYILGTLSVIAGVKDVG